MARRSRGSVASRFPADADASPAIRRCKARSVPPASGACAKRRSTAKAVSGCGESGAVSLITCVVRERSFQAERPRAKSQQRLFSRRWIVWHARIDRSPLIGIDAGGVSRVGSACFRVRVRYPSGSILRLCELRAGATGYRAWCAAWLTSSDGICAMVTSCD